MKWRDRGIKMQIDFWRVCINVCNCSFFFFYPFVSSKSFICMLFSSVPALLMACHPGLSRKAASSVGLGINPGIMALMPSWVEAKLFKKYWLPESLSLLFLSPPLSIFCHYLFKLCSSFFSALHLSLSPLQVLYTVHTSQGSGWPFPGLLFAD